MWVGMRDQMVHRIISFLLAAAWLGYAAAACIPQQPLKTPTLPPTPLISSPTASAVPDTTPPSITNAIVDQSRYCLWVTNHAPGPQLIVVKAQIEDASGIAMVYIMSRYVSKGGFVGKWAKSFLYGVVNGTYDFSPTPGIDDRATTVWDNKANWTGVVEMQIFARDPAGNLAQSEVLKLPFYYECG